MDLFNFRSSEPEHVIGSSTIEHGPRVKLGLTCEEYSMVKLILYCIDKNRSFDFARIYRHLGFDESQTDQIVQSLVDKEILVMDEVKGNKIMPVWEQAHTTHYKTTFDEFWKPYRGLSWPGSKKLSAERFSIAAQKFGSRYILHRKHAYMDFLLRPENRWRKIMNASTFLSVSTEHFNQPWETYGTNTPESQMKVKAMSKQQKEKLFE